MDYDEERKAFNHLLYYTTKHETNVGNNFNYVKTALITANNSALKEVAGPGSILLDEINSENIAKAIQQFWENNEKRQKAIDINFTFAQQFSHENIALQWIETYEQLAHES